MAWPEPRNTGMLYRRVGNSGLHVSVIGLGGWLTFGGHVENELTFACMKQAYDLGVNFFDTAESYAGGQSEIIMGQAIKKFGWSRSDLVISTKLNWGAANGSILINNHGLSRKHILEGCRASLARLDLDYVDIIYAHRPDRLTPMEETVRAFHHLIVTGLAFYWGTSEWSADEIAEAIGVAKEFGLIKPVVEQPGYNLLNRRVESAEMRRVCLRGGVGLTVYSPLAMGVLSGKYSVGADEEGGEEGGKEGEKKKAAAPPKGTRFAVSGDKFAKFVRAEMYGGEEWKGNVEKAARLKPIAERLGVPQAQLALAWCLKNENVASVITGASRPEQIVENVKCLSLLEKLTPEIMEEIDGLLGNKPAAAPARQD